MVADPNWLLSAAAQSSAAVVAIVGGFISIRLMGLVADKSSIQSRLGEKRQQVDRLKQEQDMAIRRFQEYRVNQFLDGIVHELRDEDEMPTVDEVASRHKGEPLDDSVLSELYEQLKERIVRAREWIASLGDLVEEGPLKFDEWVREHQLDITGIDTDEALWVYNRERTERMKRKQQAHPLSRLLPLFPPDYDRLITYLPQPAIEATRMQQRSQRYNELRERIESLSFQVRLGQGECDDLELRLRHFRYPSGLWILLVILLYLAAIGIIYPLSLMPAVSLSAPAGYVLVWGIGVGLLALVTYFIIEFYKLRK